MKAPKKQPKSSWKTKKGKQKKRSCMFLALPYNNHPSLKDILGNNVRDDGDDGLNYSEEKMLQLSLLYIRIKQRTVSLNHGRQSLITGLNNLQVDYELMAHANAKWLTPKNIIWFSRSPHNITCQKHFKNIQKTVNSLHNYYYYKQKELQNLKVKVIHHLWDPTRFVNKVDAYYNKQLRFYSKGFYCKTIEINREKEKQDFLFQCETQFVSYYENLGCVGTFVEDLNRQYCLAHEFLFINQIYSVLNKHIDLLNTLSSRLMVKKSIEYQIGVQQQKMVNYFLDCSKNLTHFETLKRRFNTFRNQVSSLTVHDFNSDGHYQYFRTIFYTELNNYNQRLNSATFFQCFSLQRTFISLTYKLKLLRGSAINLDHLSISDEPELNWDLYQQWPQYRDKMLLDMRGMTSPEDQKKALMPEFLAIRKQLITLKSNNTDFLFSSGTLNQFLDQANVQQSTVYLQHAVLLCIELEQMEHSF